MLSPFAIAFLFAVGIFLIAMGAVRPPGTVFAPGSSDSLKDTIELRLRQAGITHVSAGMVLSGMLAGAGVMAVVGFVAGGVAGGLVLAFLVPLAAWFDLDRRSRRWREKLTGRMVPAFRKIQSQIAAGITPQRAFEVAITEDALLSWVLREQLRSLQVGEDFDTVIASSVEAIPLRAWAQFVASMQAFSQSGGSLSEVLAKNVNRINSKILLRNRLMGDLGQFRGQQLIILIFAILIPTALFLIGGSTFGSLFSSAVGIAALFVAVGLVMFALTLTQRAVRDVESKMEN